MDKSPNFYIYTNKTLLLGTTNIISAPKVDQKAVSFVLLHCYVIVVIWQGDDHLYVKRNNFLIVEDLEPGLPPLERAFQGLFFS